MGELETGLYPFDLGLVIIQPPTDGGMTGSIQTNLKILKS